MFVCLFRVVFRCLYAYFEWFKNATKSRQPAADFIDLTTGELSPPPNQEAWGGPSYVGPGDLTPSRDEGQASRFRPGQVNGAGSGAAEGRKEHTIIDGLKSRLDVPTEVFLKLDQCPKRSRVPRSPTRGSFSLPNISMPPIPSIRIVSEADSVEVPAEINKGPAWSMGELKKKTTGMATHH